MNCVTYARVSTDKQAEKDLSIPAQLEAMREYARAQKWVVVDEFVEPGATATTADRPVLQRMLASIPNANPTIEIVLVHKLDRMARNIEDHVAIRAALRKAGIRLASVTENVDDSVSGQLIENIMASFAQFYSDNLSTEVKKGMRQKVLNGGWPHRPPRGYFLTRRAEGARNEIEIHPKDGPLMRRAFELYGSGWHSIRSISRLLARDGLLSSTGGPISEAHFRRLLSNSFYVGKVRWHHQEHPGIHVPLISAPLFEKVQTLIHQRHRDPGVKGSVNGFTLRGLAVCASCRGHMTAERHRRWGYYRCSRQSFRRELCGAKFCNSERAHQGIARICQQIRLNRTIARSIQSEAERVIEQRSATSAARRQEVLNQRGTLLASEMRLTDGFTTGDVSPSVFKAKIAEIRSQQAMAEKALQRTTADPKDLATSVTRTLELAASLWDLYERFDNIKRAELLRSVFKAVVLDHNGVVGVTLNPPFDELMGTGPRTSSDDQRIARRLIEAA